jgi:4-hydroxy-tetrahydrodipicolinate synthase
MSMSASNGSHSTSRTSPDFRGCFTAITTPFTPDASKIDYARLEEQIAFQAAGGVRGIIVSGTTGESPTLEHDEYESLVKRAIDIGHRHNLLVIAGTGSNSTAHAIAMHTFAASAGADGSLSVNPYYNKPTQDGLIRHFEAIAHSAPLSIILYNIPGRSGVGLSLETIKRLAQHPSIRAIKDAAGNIDLTAETVAACPNLTVLSGDDPLTLPMMAVGAVGVISVVSNIVPARISQLCAAYLSGRHGDALEIHRELLPLMKALFLETNPIPVKAAMKLQGRDTGSMRLPMTEATAATIDRLRQVLPQVVVKTTAVREHARA